MKTATFRIYTPRGTNGTARTLDITYRRKILKSFSANVANDNELIQLALAYITNLDEGFTGYTIL